MPLPSGPINPLRQLADDLAKAVANGEPSANFFALATVDEAGHPRVRTVTQRRVGEKSVLFSAHSSSPKARHLRQQPACEAMVFLAMQARQYRLRGSAEWRTAGELAELYRATPTAAQAWDDLYEGWAQSSFVSEREALRSAYAQYLERRGDRAAAPAAGAGYIQLIPDFVEIQELEPEARQHERRIWSRVGEKWVVTELVP